MAVVAERGPELHLGGFCHLRKSVSALQMLAVRTLQAPLKR